MRTKLLAQYIAVLSVIAMAAPIFAKSDAATNDSIVVIVSIDGVAGFYVNDPKSDIATIRQLAKEGASAELMKASLPTVTWPNHTTLVTGVSPGKHGVIANSYWDRQQSKVFRLLPDPTFNKDEIVKVPTLYDIAHEAGLKTAGISWPASRGAPTLDWTTPDVFSDALMDKYMTPSLKEEFHAAGIPYEKQEVWCKTDKGRERDIMYTQMLVHIIAKHRPNLALLHLVEVDHVEHATGPRSPEAYAAVHFEDERVREIRDALEKNFPRRATLIVTSDHGFIGVRQKIQANVALRKAGLLKVEGGKMTERRAFALDQGGSTFIYVLDKEHRAELIKQIAGMFKGVEGIDLVIEPKDFSQHGQALPEQDARMADVILTAKDGYAFSDKADDDLLVTAKSSKMSGAHGHNPELPDMYAMFVAWGRGIQPGATVKQIDNRDVAPTAAALLGLQMKDVEGHVLKTILKK